MQTISKELLLDRVAPGEGTVLILGSTGTGKTHLAREIHKRSQRNRKPFVSVNLGTLNENLFESELFGHEKGAFSGAHQSRVGKFEAAQGGTIFLDEIGELTLSMQTRLLDLIYTKTLSPVGSNRVVNLDVRIIAATNRNLKEMVKKGEFREDLFFRLNIFSTRLPDISKDPEQLQTWILRFLREHQTSSGDVYSLSQCALRKLLEHSWPGNLRELRNCIEYAVTMANGPLITANDLPIYTDQSADTDPGTHTCFPLLFHQAKAEFEETFLRAMLSRFNGKINKTARETQISKVTLIEKIRRYQIDIESIKYQNYISSKVKESGNYLTNI